MLLKFHLFNVCAANIRVAHDDTERRSIGESCPHALAQPVLATNNNREARAGKQTSTECKQTLMLMLNDANFDFFKNQTLSPLPPNMLFKNPLTY